MRISVADVRINFSIHVKMPTLSSGVPQCELLLHIALPTVIDGRRNMDNTAFVVSRSNQRFYRERKGSVKLVAADLD
jgi:hypothetical protein